ncbi:RimJ/RimL family protein N-acetyltransferase [Virgibacillus phasianinus]|uniref:RimJ/RimL family protein N-acetyltransferase n=1 Tax=Virgibacillus phasianinus TaxID=2017483 RepID=A0A220TZT3_9BACI|nr:GNAT family protein [Virgibacillus phasianinus]ASK61544.1 RimJ/RimL family protein N-acetyltransferase [Virgibacillus phasianinus]
MKGTNIYVRSFNRDDAEALLALQKENRAFFEKFSMVRDPDFYTIEGQLDSIKQYQEGSKQDRAYHFGIFKNDDNRLIGTISLFQVLRGSLQSAFIGYFLDESQNGKGFTTEATKLIVKYAFEKLALHRIEAGVMPHNIGSIRVLEKAGFHREGIARKNVKINGKWEDHQVLALINPADN